MSDPAHGGLEKVRQAIISLLGETPTDLFDLLGKLEAIRALAATIDADTSSLLSLADEHTAIPPGDVPPEQPQRYPRWWRLWGQDLALKLEDVRVDVNDSYAALLGIWGWQEPLWTMMSNVWGNLDYWGPLHLDTVSYTSQQELNRGRLDTLISDTGTIIDLLDTLISVQAAANALLADLLACCQSGGAGPGVFPDGACPDFQYHYQLIGPVDLDHTLAGNRYIYFAVQLDTTQAPWIGVADGGAFLPDALASWHADARPMCIAWNLRPEWEGYSWDYVTKYTDGAGYESPFPLQLGELINPQTLGVTGQTGEASPSALPASNSSLQRSYWAFFRCILPIADTPPATNPGVWVSFGGVPA